MSTCTNCRTRLDADADTIVKIVDPTQSNGEGPRSRPFCSVECLLATIRD